MGFEATGATKSVALQGDESASLATGKTFEVTTGTIRGHVDLPVSRSRWAGLGLRFGLGIRFLRGKLDAVSLGELEALAPGLADLIVETARDFDGFIPLGEETLAQRGSDAFAVNLADQLELMDVGGELTVGFLGYGPRFDLGSVALELGELELGGFFHLSDLRITLTDRQQQPSRNRYLGLGFGLTLRIAPLSIVLHHAGGARFQPAALRLDLFALMTRGDLRAIVVAVSYAAQIAWPF